jgi:hypothetical protein
MAKDLGSSFGKVSNSNDEKLLNISLWAKRFSWIVFSLYAINFLTRTAFQLQDVFGEWSVGLSISFLADLLAIPVVGMIYFLILQTISRVVPMLMEHDNVELIRTLKFKRNNTIRLVPLLANWCAWLILSLSTIYFLANSLISFPHLAEVFRQGCEFYYCVNELGIWSQMFITFIIGVVYFLILQAISNSILVFQEKKS